MKKVLVLGLVGLSLLGVACSGADDPAPLPSGAAGDPLAARIANLTGAEVLGRAEEGATEAQMYVATTGGSPVLGKLAPSEALAFLGNVGGRVPTAGELATPTEWRVPGAGATLRFPRVVPGTNVPVFDSAVVVSGHDDGSFAFLGLDPLPDLHGFNVAPSVSEERARALALGSLGLEDAEGLTVTVTLGVLREGAPRLVYRVEISAEEPVRVHIDAKTAEVLDSGAIGLDLTVKANEAASYYSPTDPRHKPANAVPFLPFTVDDSGRPWVTTIGGTVQIFDGRPGKTLSILHSTKEPGSTAIVDVDPAAETNTFTDGLAVDTQFHTVNAVEILASFGLRFRMKDTLVPVYVHAGTPGNGAYDPVTQTLRIGDGEHPDSKDSSSKMDPRHYKHYSVGTQFDSLAHEIAHGGIVSLGLPLAVVPRSTAPKADRDRFVETRSLHEGLADVFGAAAEILYKRRTGASMVGAYAIGEGRTSSADGLRPVRDLQNPWNDKAETKVAPNVKSWQKYNPGPNESKEVIFLKSMQHDAYFRSGLVSHTWALLSAGGTNIVSDIVIDKPIGVEMATATFGLAALSFRYSKPTLRGFADATVAANLLPDLRKQVVCAWKAVDIYSDADLATYRVSCTKATTTAAPMPSSACGGKADGYYCDPEQPFAAVRCQGGAIAGGLQCPSGLVCQPAGGAPGSPALVESGALRCAPPKETP